jgi:hypothetical protein
MLAELRKMTANYQDGCYDLRLMRVGVSPRHVEMALGHVVRAWKASMIFPRNLDE